MSNWYDEFGKANEASWYEIESLGDVAAACYRLGLDRLAEELGDIAKRLETFRQTQRDAIGGKIHEDMVNANQNTANVIRAMLAGSELAKYVSGGENERDIPQG